MNEWTEAEEALLRELWADGVTAGGIAKKLANRSRNAVIGKAHRLCLAARVSPIEVPEVAMRPVNWSRNRCKWIDGEPTANPTFCGKHTDGGSWCKDHYKRVFRKPEEKAA